MKKPIIHLICNAHLDPVWQWRWDEGCSEAISTFRTAVEIIKENNNFIFNHNEAVLYQWVQKYDPALFKEIKSLIKKGRWFISGGWYLQPDVNLPGTESLFRQIIEGRRFFKDEFGVVPLVAYNFDSFGHSGGLPQILKITGYKMYIHMRPQEADLKLPNDLYRWKGVDDSEILAYRTRIGFYHTERENNETIEDRLNDGVKYALEINRDIAIFWGLGDHGGGATREDTVKISEYIKKEKRVEIIHSTPDRFYDAVKRYGKAAPVVHGELQKIFTGCYTSASRLKRASQKSLSELVQTESIRTASWWLLGQKYPEDQFRDIWKDHIFNDFHDILPGSSTELVEQDVLNQYGKVFTSIQRERLSAAAEYNQNLECESPSIPVTIINTNPNIKRAPVEVECMIDYRPKWTGKWHLKLFDMQNKEIPMQEEPIEANLAWNGWRRKVSFYADLPSIGTANYKLELCEGEKKYVQAPSLLKLDIDHFSGLINGLKSNGGNEILSDLLFKPLVAEDSGDSWGTDIWSYKNITGYFESDKQPQIIATGPVRTIIESSFKHNHSRISLRTIAYSEFPVIEFRFRIHWNEEKKRLKLAIPSAFKNAKLLCEIPGGLSVRNDDGQEQYQNRWLVLYGNLNGKEYALGIINNGQYGIDFEDGQIGLTLLRSPAYCHFKDFDLGNTYRKFQDQGVHDIRLIVITGTKESVMKSASSLADFLSAPPVAYSHLPFGKIGKQNKKKKAINDLLSFDKQNIRLLACKQSIDKKAMILRFQETIGEKTILNIKLNSLVKKIKLNFKPLEIKTIRIEKDGKWKAVGVIEEK